jgi:hypothetical protein
MTGWAYRTPKYPMFAGAANTTLAPSAYVDIALALESGSARGMIEVHASTCQRTSRVATNVNFLLTAISSLLMTPQVHPAY